MYISRRRKSLETVLACFFAIFDCLFKTLEVLTSVSVLSELCAFALLVIMCMFCISACICLFLEADLGMFSMFGRTGAPQKEPPQEDRQIFAT